MTEPTPLQPIGSVSVPLTTTLDASPIGSAPVGAAPSGAVPTQGQGDLVSAYMKNYFNSWRDERMKTFRPMNEFVGKYG